MEIHFYIPFDQWWAWLLGLSLGQRIVWCLGGYAIVAWVFFAWIAHFGSAHDPTDLIVWALSPLLVAVLGLFFAGFSVAWTGYLLIRVVGYAACGIPWERWPKLKLPGMEGCRRIAEHG